MKQVIARLDEHLHDELKKRAASEGRSMNALMTDLLASGLLNDDPRAAMRRRLEAEGLRVRVPRPHRAPSLDAVVASTRGAGNAASRALEEDRKRG